MKANWQNTAVVIPVFNSVKYLPELLDRILENFPQTQIFVVDDGSVDNSVEICKKYEVNLIELSQNYGKGKALQIGFEAALNQKFKFAFSIDSDLQHEPEDFAKFIQKQNEVDADMVIGNRTFSIEKMPFMRILSNRITSGIVSLASGNKIYDSQSGYRLYSLQKMENMKFKSTRYQFETEIILKFAKTDGKFAFVPIKTIYDGQKSYISHFRDIKDFVKIILNKRKI
ncbi:MAG: glycosyltransferase family 2 protein [Candidatus Cloacimonetes bacterium]|jgi:glycosyltransferase involved in cell wall biosynthesis|nr:glycosyltransferase family 2 protein [Candidatus Cloacimonadota bacterium]MBT6994795.1 glycosyltransferase family 2 protein [Candidatus Cloacimonadota bacterium]MBT7469198.1 glycosyltransferase family 2 protein [Candidatus Cloacimonadota bacterium]